MAPRQRIIHCYLQLNGPIGSRRFHIDRLSRVPRASSTSSPSCHSARMFVLPVAVSHCLILRLSTDTNQSKVLWSRSKPRYPAFYEWCCGAQSGTQTDPCPKITTTCSLSLSRRAMLCAQTLRRWATSRWP